jgi:hypothetical protein
LEMALNWISERDYGEEKPAEYMSKHQQDVNAKELWEYFQSVIEWTQKTFTTYRKDMKGVEWGLLYNKYKDNKYDPKDIEKETLKLINDDEVQSLKGVYPYILTRDEKYLNLRDFDDKTKRKAYEQQKGVCPFCKKEKREKIKWEFAEMEADHITPWHEGGKTIAENCQMLCKDDNRRKSGK